MVNLDRLRDYGAPKRKQGVNSWRIPVPGGVSTLVPWLITDSRVLDLLIKKSGIPSDFRDIYLNRHKHSIDFIQKIIDLKSEGFSDEFYFS
jgi:hypothetical protein